MKISILVTALAIFEQVAAFHVAQPTAVAKTTLSMSSPANGDTRGAAAAAAIKTTPYSTPPRPAAPAPVGGAKLAGGTPAAAKAPVKKSVKNIWDSASEITVQGNSLRTWSFTTPAIERVAVLLKTEGRPLNADIELWQGPDNTPQKMAVYIEDGSLRPFSAIIETPRGQNAIAIRNTGHMEFPLTGGLEADVEGSAGLGAVTNSLAENAQSKIVQGGAVMTWPFEPSVASVQIMLKTDGRPLNARVELLQGPNNNKQVIDLYTEDGNERPFFAIIETPGTGNVVRIINTATVEFPLTARVEPYLIEEIAPDNGGGGYFVIDKQW